jgi:dihydroorotase-like cyclic amidohydrolase
MRTLIKNATIVTASDRYEANILIEDEKIIAISADFLPRPI